jgi:hypothetical protein
MATRKEIDRQKEIDEARASRGEVTTIKIGNRTFSQGDTITITRERGVFTFRFARVVNGVCQDITVFGGVRGRQKFRAFTPDRIKAKKRVVKGAGDTEE